jgi:hypothetical protein
MGYLLIFKGIIVIACPYFIMVSALQGAHNGNVNMAIMALKADFYHNYGNKVGLGVTSKYWIDQSL